MKIAIINNKQAARKELNRIVSESGEHDVVWSTSSGARAIEFCKTIQPTLILMDPILRDIDGMSVIRQIMSTTPCAILIVTKSVENRHEMVFDAMGAGAIDVANIPIFDSSNYENAVNSLKKKISIIEMLTRDSQLPEERSAGNSLNPLYKPAKNNLIIIGCSSGGPEALVQILSQLPQDFQSPIVIVQHVDAAFAPGLAKWLNTKSAIPVELAKEGDRLVPGKVLVAATNRHLKMSREGRLAYSDQPINTSYRPSVDVFFKSVARNWQHSVTAVILTGMGKDGAQGLLQLMHQGAHTIAQDELSSAVFGMPKAAIELGAAVEVLTIKQITISLEGRGRINMKNMTFGQELGQE